MTEAETVVLQLEGKELKDCQPPPETGRCKEGFSPESQREQGPGDTLISDF